MGLSKVVEVRILIDKIRKTNSLDELGDCLNKLDTICKEDGTGRSVGEYVTGCLATYNSLTCY